jgi:hypothetical protein
MRFKAIIAILLISTSAMAQRKVVSYDGTNFYSEGGATNLAAIPGLGTAEYEAQSNARSAGRLWGGCVSVTNDTIYIEAGGGLCKTDTVGGDLSACPTNITDGFGAPLVYVEWADTNLTALVGYNIIFYDYTTGVLTNILKADFFTLFDAAQDFTVGRTYYDTVYGSVARLCGMNVWSAQRRNQIYHDLKNPVELVSGGVVSATGNKIAVTGSRLVAEGYDHFTADALTTNDNWNLWYKTNSVFTFAATNLVDLLNYNDITEATGLVAMTPNRWRRDIIYLIHDGSVHIVMGQDEYGSEALARGAATPLPPDLVSAYGTAIAELTVKRGDNPTIYNANVTSFQTASIPSHNELSGLQGGATDAYYHSDQAINSNSSPTFVSIKFAAGDYLIGNGTNLFYITADGATTNALTSN